MNCLLLDHAVIVECVIIPSRRILCRCMNEAFTQGWLACMKQGFIANDSHRVPSKWSSDTGLAREKEGVLCLANNCQHDGSIDTLYYATVLSIYDSS